MKKHYVVIIVLGVLLVLALGYIAYTKFQEAEQEKLLGAFQSGYEQAILTIIEQARQCEPVPLYAGNVTINLISAECLQQTEA
jgi:type II secretory pathway pseudopilin PulG